jgi:carboxymethylenebutenolidase
MRVDLPSGTPAELALPAGPPARGLVLLPDIGGMRPLFDDLAARLADEQHWAVIVVEPFPGQRLPTMDDRFAAVPLLNDISVLGDASAAADLLFDRTAVTRIGVMGFCMGGMYALKAASTPRFDRAVAFYGMIRLPVAWRGGGQGQPLDLLAAGGGCPVLAIIGDKDPFTPSQDVDDLARLSQVSVVRFPDAEHAFVHDPERPSHRPGDAAQAWRQAIGFLA